MERVWRAILVAPMFFISVFPDPPGAGVLSVKSMCKMDSAISAKC